MRGREDEFETASRLIGEPRPGFLGDMRGMIVEDQLDRRMGRIRGIDELSPSRSSSRCWRLIAAWKKCW
jgi:hypothetical protein